MTSKSYTVGDKQSFTEYLSPARDKGTKMLKLGKELWMYSPSTDRTIMISGHMLRQSLMGSDLSYEDMMEDRRLAGIYTPRVVGGDTVDGRPCHLLHLASRVDAAAYDSRKLWVDAERLVPLVQELYAKSGQLLKRVTLSDVRRVDGRWFPTRMNYKDVLKEGGGTDWIIATIAFDAAIPAHLFSKASLKQ
jgi:outer membrane lipoprotein-sorting protein